MSKIFLLMFIFSIVKSQDDDEDYEDHDEYKIDRPRVTLKLIQL